MNDPIDNKRFLDIFHALRETEWALEQAVLLTQLHGDKSCRILPVEEEELEPLFVWGQEDREIMKARGVNL